MRKKLFRTVVPLVVAGAILTGCERLSYLPNSGSMDEIAKQPHTARLLNYAITFPKASQIQDSIPGALESAGIEISEFNELDDHNKLGKKGSTYTAQWLIYHPKLNQATIEFMVNQHSAPDAFDKWEAPWRFTNTTHTPDGTINVNGLQFSIMRWTGDFDDPATHAIGLDGIDYLARDKNGEVIRLRASNVGNDPQFAKLILDILKSPNTVPLKPMSESANDPKPIVSSGAKSANYELITP